MLLALNDHNEAEYLSKLDRWEKPGGALCNKCSEVAKVRFGSLGKNSLTFLRGCGHCPRCSCVMLGCAKSGRVGSGERGATSRLPHRSELLQRAFRKHLAEISDKRRDLAAEQAAGAVEHPELGIRLRGLAP
jgi:hypothetical protein